MEATLLSDKLFGRPCRLPLAIWIMESPKDRFFQSEPPWELGGATAIRQELVRFVELGLLDEERPEGDRRIYYVRQMTPLWDVIAAARDALPEA